MHMENTNTARNFALQLGSLVALYASLSAIIMLAFGVITLLQPDPQSMYYEYQSAQSGIRFGIALLIVFFPTYVVLTRFVNSIRRKETGTYLTLTKWLVYLSLLVGGCILLGDAVSVILAYLNGEITVRFILKAASMLIVIGGAFFYYIKDAQGYWLTHEKESKLYGLCTSVVVCAILILGFTQSDSPTEIRELASDEKQTQDLMDMEWRITDHYNLNKALPQTTGELYVGVEEPKAPEGRNAYKYIIVDEDTYQLCATYAFSSERVNGKIETQPMATEAIKNPYSTWDHTSGETCFERTAKIEEPYKI